ncbi:MAG: hypothetical protein AB1758_08860 [Candidatus Eremiobacterota bacterium]
MSRLIAVGEELILRLQGREMEGLDDLLAERTALIASAPAGERNELLEQDRRLMEIAESAWQEELDRWVVSSRPEPATRPTAPRFLDLRG